MSPEQRWVSETYDDHLRPAIKAERILLDKRSDYQHIVIFENAFFGRVLMLDDIFQLTAADEFIYHEMMAHVPLITHANPSRVLIVGGGDGGVLRETLRHPSVERAVLCEIDGDVIDACREWFPQVSAGAYDDPRAEVVVEDATRFLDRTEETFDVIIIDTSEPVGPSERVFQEKLVADCRSRLAHGGILIMQTGISFVSRGHIANTHRMLSQHFATSTRYRATVPTYVGGAITIALASGPETDVDLPVAVLSDRAETRALLGTTRYWTPAVHKAAFAEPPYITNAIRAAVDGRAAD